MFLRGHSGCLYREWVWGRDQLGTLIVPRKKWIAFGAEENGNGEKWMNSHF